MVRLAHRLLIRATAIDRRTVVSESKRPSVAETDEVETSILAYLGAHPHAADTLDGILSWWLPRQRYVSARERIEVSLSRLVHRGVLRRDRLPDGSDLYALRDALAQTPSSH